MDIAEVAKLSGVPASTLRFYEQKGLIASTGRRGLRRLFSANVLEWLALIALGRSVGFSLDGIARMLGADGRPRIDRKLLADKAQELDSAIRRLIAMRNGLRHAAACAAPSHMECPTFRRLLGLAASGAISAGDKKSPKRRAKKNVAAGKAVNAAFRHIADPHLTSQLARDALSLTNEPIRMQLMQ